MTKYEQLQKYLKNNQNTWLVNGVAIFIVSHLLEYQLKHMISIGDEAIDWYVNSLN